MVALLVPEDQRRRPGMLIESLTAHYTSPGRLSQRRRQFEQMTRPVGEDPAVFAIALESLARRAFVDVDPTVRLQLVRDKFITGQTQLALRRHLDSAGPDTPMVDIVDKCRVWESHAELIGRPEMECEPGTSRGVFHVREEVMDDKKEETAAEPDSNYAKLGNLTDRLRELVKQPRPAGSRPVDIGQLLRQLLPIEDEANEVGQPMSGAESADNCMSGKRGLIRGEGLVTRISPDREPQRDDFRNFYEEPDIRVNSALIKSLGSRWPNNVDSDDSEDDDVLPQEECWTPPDDGWTLVERPQVKSRGVRFKTTYQMTPEMAEYSKNGIITML